MMLTCLNLCINLLVMSMMTTLAEKPERKEKICQQLPIHNMYILYIFSLVMIYKTAEVLKMHTDVPVRCLMTSLIASDFYHTTFEQTVSVLEDSGQLHCNL